jgi:dolichol-phosphate mannosyltransferase
VVDDGSPDGTGDVVDRMGSADERIHALHRSGKQGLGSAYVAGFRWALENGAQSVLQMDADFSHDPRAIPSFMETLNRCHVVIGSRYLTGANVVNWPIRRLILSYTANLYTRMITGMPLKDCTGGFKLFRREALEALDLERIESDGYAFQTEVSYRLWRSGFTFEEIPIVFVDRHSGTSKMSKRIIWEASWMMWRLRFSDLFQPRAPERSVPPLG